MNVALWGVQILLALAFLAHGLMLLFPPESLIEVMNASMSTGLRLLIGAAEVMAAIGLTVPGVTRIRPSLVSWAAVGLMVIMAGATVFHIRRGETSGAATTAVLFLLAAFVASMRWKAHPILPRTVVRPPAM